MVGAISDVGDSAQDPSAGRALARHERGLVLLGTRARHLREREAERGRERQREAERGRGSGVGVGQCQHHKLATYTNTQDT